MREEEKALNYPTDLFIILELWNLTHDVSELHKIRRLTDYEALNLRKGRSGQSAKIQSANLKSPIWDFHRPLFLSCGSLGSTKYSLNASFEEKKKIILQIPSPRTFRLGHKFYGSYFFSVQKRLLKHFVCNLESMVPTDPFTTLEFPENKASLPC